MVGKVQIKKWFLQINPIFSCMLICTDFIITIYFISIRFVKKVNLYAVYYTECPEKGELDIHFQFVYIKAKQNFK